MIDVQFWISVYAVGVTSNECLAQLQTLLSRRSNVDIVKGFKKSEARKFVDFLDRVSGLTLLRAILER